MLLRVLGAFPGLGPLCWGVLAPHQPVLGKGSFPYLCPGSRVLVNRPCVCLGHTHPEPLWAPPNDSQKLLDVTLPSVEITGKRIERKCGNDVSPVRDLGNV